MIASHAARGRGGDDVRAERPHHLNALRGRVLRHDGLRSRSRAQYDHHDAMPDVAARRLDELHAGAGLARSLARRDHGTGGAVVRSPPGFVPPSACQRAGSDVRADPAPRGGLTCGSASSRCRGTVAVMATEPNVLLSWSPPSMRWWPTAIRARLEIDNLESAALPSKRRVIEALEHLKSALSSSGSIPRTRFIATISARSSRSTSTRRITSSSIRSSERSLRPLDGPGGRSRFLRIGEGVVLALFEAIPELRRLRTRTYARPTRGSAAKNVEGDRLRVSVARGDRRLSAREPPLPRRRADDPSHHHGARTRARASTSVPARASASGSSSTTAPAWWWETTVIGNGVKLYRGVTLGALSVPASRRSEEAPSHAGRRRHHLRGRHHRGRHRHRQGSTIGETSGSRIPFRQTRRSSAGRARRRCGRRRRRRW